MAFTIRLKNSITQDRLPVAGSAAYGELFINANSASAQLQIKATDGTTPEMRAVGGVIVRATEPPSALEGTLWWDTTDTVLKLREGGAWVSLSEPVNLAEGNATATTVDVTNTAGTDATLQSATDQRAGLLSAADKSKLDAYPATPAASQDLGYTADPAEGTVTITGGVDATLPVVDATNAGLMSPGDKAKLDGYPATLPSAQAQDLSYSAGSTEGVVEIVGGTNATIPLVDATNAGLMSPGDKTKLDTAPADIQQAIDDAEAAATAAGQAMDLQAVTDNGDTTTNGATFGGDVDIHGVLVGRGGGDSDTNLRVGPNALANNTTGENNIAIGRDALAANTTGVLNTAIGRYALASNTEGYGNVAFGRETMRYNVDGNINAAFGSNALTFNTSGSFNSALGNDALNKNTTGDLNVGLGRLALVDSETGSRNIGVGANAGQGIVTGSNNTIIGGITGTAALSNTIVIGAGIKERIRVDSTGSFLFGGTLPASPNIELNNDGSATFATGDISLKTDGSVDLTTVGDAITINGSNAAGVDTQIRFTMSGNVGEVGSTGTGINNGQGNIWLATRDGSNIEKALYINGTRDVLIGGVLPASPEISLYANGRADFSGKITLTGASPAGIQFGSTNSGGAIQSQTLNDYEEGTFTPTVEQGITSPIYDTGATFGRYRIIGKQFFFSLRVSLSGGTAEDIQLRLGGLPVVPAGGAVYLYPQIGIFQRGAGKTGVIAVPRASSTILDIQNINDGSDITGTEATNTLILVATGAYPI